MKAIHRELDKGIVLYSITSDLERILAAETGIRSNVGDVSIFPGYIFKVERLGVRMGRG